MYFSETIAAISTPLGCGGISIIRVSGKDAIKIVDTIYKSPKNKKLYKVKTHTINYGYIIKKDSEENKIDEVLISVMRKPNTYTKEDIVEINCHGGIVSTKKVLEEVLKAGAVLAEEGEFTKRAFLNGRLDLVQAESIIDIINSKTDLGLKSAVDHLEGSLSKKITQIRKSLLNIAANMQVTIDYPEEDIEEITKPELIEGLKDIERQISSLIKTADAGKIIKEGINTVIIGRPNVGKSSLLNVLINEEKAIVTEIPGTTRDSIEEYINIQGIPLKIIDTAGIRETKDIVEKIGVEKTKSHIKNADLIIIIIDGSEPLTLDDKNIINDIQQKQVIVLINKTDLKINVDYEYIKKALQAFPIIKVSTKEKIGIKTLENTIKEMFFSGEINKSENQMFITNIRHKQALIKAKEDIKVALENLDAGLPTDIIYIDISNAISNLGEIVGLTVSEEIVDEIFQKFCLGK